MKWDPDIYANFADERTRPAADLLGRIPLRSPARVIDLGCGPGNSTALLTERWPDANIEGLELSQAMLVKARDSGVRAHWIVADIADWAPAKKYDLVFSNAALHGSRIIVHSCPA